MIKRRGFIKSLAAAALALIGWKKSASAEDLAEICRKEFHDAEAVPLKTVPLIRQEFLDTYRGAHAQWGGQRLQVYHYWMGPPNPPKVRQKLDGSWEVYSTRMSKWCPVLYNEHAHYYYWIEEVTVEVDEDGIAVSVIEPELTVDEA